MNKRKSNAGRKTKYKPEYAQEAYRQCLLGCTDAQLADLFKVANSTISEWKKYQRDFAKAVKAGKEVADGKVAEAFYKRATGYTTEELVYEDGKLKKVIKKEVPPDPGAAFNWLKNRAKDKWRDKIEVETTTHEEQVFKVGGQIIKF